MKHLILSRIEVTAKLAELDILGVPLSKPLDNHEILSAERVAFMQRNRGVNVLKININRIKGTSEYGTKVCLSHTQPSTIGTISHLIHT